jgi:hypothetical protein
LDLKGEAELDEAGGIGDYFEEASPEKRIHVVIRTPEPIGVESNNQLPR